MRAFVTYAWTSSSRSNRSRAKPSPPKRPRSRNQPDLDSALRVTVANRQTLPLYAQDAASRADVYQAHRAPAGHGCSSPPEVDRGERIEHECWNGTSDEKLE